MTFITAPTRLVSLENTHNRGGGAVYPMDRIQEIHDVARAEGLAMHLDGARLMNATVASGLKAPEITGYFDSCTLCLSKGLGAPVGSVIAASGDFIRRAQRYRKMFGGGMRQAGHPGRPPAFTHWRTTSNASPTTISTPSCSPNASAASPACALSRPMWKPTSSTCNSTPPRRRVDAPGLAAAMSQRGVLALAMGRYGMRLVTHLDVSCEQVEQAAEIMRSILNGQ